MTKTGIRICCCSSEVGRFHNVCSFLNQLLHGKWIIPPLVYCYLTRGSPFVFAILIQFLVFYFCALFWLCDKLRWLTVFRCMEFHFPWILWSVCSRAICRWVVFRHVCLRCVSTYVNLIQVRLETLTPLRKCIWALLKYSSSNCVSITTFE